MLCPVTCMPSSGVLLNIKETSGADFVCLLMPDATHDAAIALYGADALFHPTYEALVASAYHLSITRGLPIYEFSFILDGTAHQVIVEKSTEDVLLNAKKYKQLLSKIDISDENYSLYAKKIEAQEACLSLMVDNVSAVDINKLSQLIFSLEKENRAPCVVWSKEDLAQIRFLPYAKREASPTFSAHLVALFAADFVGELTLGTDGLCRISRSQVKLRVHAKLLSVLEFELCP